MTILFVYWHVRALKTSLEIVMSYIQAGYVVCKNGTLAIVGRTLGKK